MEEQKPEEEKITDVSQINSVEYVPGAEVLQKALDGLRAAGHPEAKMSELPIRQVNKELRKHDKWQEEAALQQAIELGKYDPVDAEKAALREKYKKLSE